MPDSYFSLSCFGFDLECLFGDFTLNLYFRLLKTVGMTTCRCLQLLGELGAEAEQETQEGKEVEAEAEAGAEDRIHLPYQIFSGSNSMVLMNATLGKTFHSMKYLDSQG